ncbi:MAG: MOSC domain-containing protein [Hyphomicrobiales bacterium]
MTQANITGIFRYPVKGLNAESLAEAAVSEGECIAGDRAWAIEAGTGKFDTANPQHYPKVNFLMLAREERLAALDCRFDSDTGVLTILRDGKQVARGNLNEKIGRQLLEQFFAAFVPEASRGVPKFVHGGDVSLSDAPVKLISIINLATVRDIERVAGIPIDPARFRGNIQIDGIEPWEEFEWLDKTLAVNGQPLMEVRHRIERCPATSVNLETAKRDIHMPRLLLNAFNHKDCGIYAKVTASGTIKAGDTLSVAD